MLIFTTMAIVNKLLVTALMKVSAQVPWLLCMLRHWLPHVMRMGLHF